MIKKTIVTTFYSKSFMMVWFSRLKDDFKLFNSNKLYLEISWNFYPFNANNDYKIIIAIDKSNIFIDIEIFSFIKYQR